MKLWKDLSFLKRFWAKVSVRGPDQCWPWSAGKSDQGYGQISRGKREEGLVYAHVASWMIANHKAVPSDQEIMHACDNRWCVNPKCLSPGTRKDNMQDARRKGRLVHSDPVKGSRHGMSKLTEGDIPTIFYLRAQGWLQRDIAKRFGINQTKISAVLHRKTWRHVRMS